MCHTCYEKKNGDTQKKKNENEIKLSTGNVTEPDSLDKLNEIIENAGENPVIIDLFASWCGPCVNFKPKFEQLAKDFKDKAIFIKIDGDKNKWASGKLD